jgi:hypothetical protein
MDGALNILSLEIMYFPVKGPSFTATDLDRQHPDYTHKQRRERSLRSRPFVSAYNDELTKATKNA